MVRENAEWWKTKREKALCDRVTPSQLGGKCKRGTTDRRRGKKERKGRINPSFVASGCDGSGDVPRKERSLALGKNCTKERPGGQKRTPGGGKKGALCVAGAVNISEVALVPRTGSGEEKLVPLGKSQIAGRVSGSHKKKKGRKEKREKRKWGASPAYRFVLPVGKRQGTGRSSAWGKAFANRSVDPLHPRDRMSAGVKREVTR